MLYRAVDYYDFGQETLYKGHSLKEAKAAAQERVRDTDGDCVVVIEKQVMRWEPAAVDF